MEKKTLLLFCVLTGATLTASAGSIGNLTSSNLRPTAHYSDSYGNGSFRTSTVADNLTIWAEESDFPDSFTEDDRVGNLSALLKNTGTEEVEGEVALTLLNESNDLVFMQYYSSFSPKPDKATSLNYPYDMTNVESGSYRLAFCVIEMDPEGSSITSHEPIKWKSGIFYKTVTVEGTTVSQETEDPKLTLDIAQSELPEKVTMNDELNVKVSITNTGGNFDNELYLMFYDESDGIIYRSEGTSVKIAQGETATATITGKVSAVSAVNLKHSCPVTYSEFVMYFEDNNTIITIEASDGSTPTITVFPDPETQAALTWLSAETELPEKFVAGEKYSLSIPMKNSGKVDFNGSSSLSILAGTAPFRSLYSVEKGISIKSANTENVTFSIELPTNLPAGNYFLQTGIREADSRTSKYSPLMTEDLSANIPISIDAKASGVEEVRTQCAVWPNPVSGQATVSASEGLRSVRLYSLAGALLLSEDCGGAEEYLLNMEDCPSGVYLLEMETPSGVRTERIIKK